MDQTNLAAYSLSKALGYIKTDNKARSFAHFLVALTLNPVWREDMYKYFLCVTEIVSEKLIGEGRIEDFFKCYEQALELYPDKGEIKLCFSRHLHKLGYTYRAFTYCRNAVRNNPDMPLWQRELDNLKNILVERWHFRMLNDRLRNDSYKKAIIKSVNTNDTVLDIGCGSGILSIFISRCKPKTIIAIESNEALCSVASNIFEDNHVENIQLINELSTSLRTRDIPERATVLVTETFDAGFFGEGILQTMIHARKHLMNNSKTDVVIPKSGSLFVCGIHSKKLSKKHLVTTNAIKDIKLFNLKIYKNSDEPYDTEDLTTFDDLKYVTNVKNILNVDFTNTENLERLLNGENRIGNIELEINCRSEIHAYAVWFELNLTDEIKITTDPRAKDRCNAWEQAVFYLNNPLYYEQKQKITFEMSCKSGKLVLLSRHDIDSSNSFTVCSDIIRILNDTTLINHCNSTAGMACVHITQIYPLNLVKILDLSPFPLIGFFLLSRGVQSLSCSNDDPLKRKLILRIAELNNINLNRIQFVEKHPKDGFDSKYHIVVSDYFVQSFGELNIKSIEAWRMYKLHHVVKEGLIIPYKITLKAKLIYSQELERITRIDNANVVDCKIAELFNIFQVNQIFISDITIFPYKSMSDEIVVYKQCLNPYGFRSKDFVLLEDGLVNGVLCWYEIQMLEKGEAYSTNVTNSFMNTTIHVLESGLEGLAKQKGNLLVTSGSGNEGYLKFAVDFNLE